MTREQIAGKLSPHRERLKALGVRSLALFGSTARREGSESSDIDLLVDFEGPASFDGYMDLKLFLEGLLGRSVDLVTRGALREELRERVEGDALDVLLAQERDA